MSLSVGLSLTAQCKPEILSRPAGEVPLIAGNAMAACRRMLLFALGLVLVSCIAGQTSSDTSPVDASADEWTLDAGTTDPVEDLVPHIVPLVGSPALAFGDDLVWAGASSRGDDALGSLASIDQAGHSIRSRAPFGLMLEDVDFVRGSLWVAATSGACVLYTCSMGGDSPPPQPRFPRENSVTRWDATGLSLQLQIPVATPYRLEAGLGGVWVTRWAEDRSAVVLKIDAATGYVLRQLRRRGDPGELALAGGGVWELGYMPARDGGWTLLQIDPETASVAGRIPLAGLREGDPLSFATDGRTLWVSSFFSGELFSFDARTGRALPEISSNLIFMTDVSFGPQGLWVVAGNLVARLDPATGEVLEGYRVMQPDGYRIPHELWSVDQTREDVWVSSGGGVFRLPLRSRSG